MLRSALLVLLLLTPADYTVCTPVPTGPIVSQKPALPFVRKPDDAFTAVASGFGTTNDGDWPPVRYQKMGTIKVAFAQTQYDLDWYCGAAPEGFVRRGCSSEHPHRLTLANPCSFPRSDDYARIVCHELAHQFGNWPGDHPR